MYYQPLNTKFTDIDDKNISETVTYGVINDDFTIYFEQI